MAHKINYQDVLNPAQLKAVMHLDGPVLVIAGAGSGKTRTLVYRVAKLVESGIPPESVLLLTFTRKAAQEMLDRASNLSDARCRFVSGGTFHSLAHRVLRMHGKVLGYSSSFTVMDRSDMEEVIRSLIPALGLPEGVPRFPKPRTLANIVSKAANIQQPISDFIIKEYGQFLEFIKPINTLEKLYQEYKMTHQMMDYDDLILNLRKVLVENKQVREELGRQYAYIMVDEYQDTNAIQADIVKWLAYEHKNIMVVGDDSQSIYSFRGANYKNMFDFSRQFSDATIVKLEENYRSTQPILTFTNALMERAAEKYTKCLFTKRTGGSNPRLIDTGTEPEQARFVCRYIKEELEQGRSIKDFAVLFRAGYHSFELEAELTRQGFHYVKYGGFKFLESAHIKDFLAHLRIVVNKNDTISWNRILRLIKNIGHRKSQSIINWMKTKRIPPDRLNEWPGAGKGDKGLKALAELISRLMPKNLKPEKAVEYVMEYYRPILESKFDDFPRRMRELEQLIPMSARYKKLRSFLDDLVLEPPTSSADFGSGDRSESLTLSTVHSAKGLEWPVVFIIWLMQGRFPSSRAYGNPLDMEEERRLMYVAATRARDQLIMCYPGKESVPFWSDFGNAERGFGNGFSSFLEGLPEEVISYESVGSQVKTHDKRRKRARLGYDKVKRASAGGIAMGDRVKHPAFGHGVVSRLVAKDKVEVLFKNVGKKLLHLEYTTLERV